MFYFVNDSQMKITDPCTSFDPHGKPPRTEGSGGNIYKDNAQDTKNYAVPPSYSDIA